MSEEAKIFRGDHAPESGTVDTARRVRRPPPAQPAPSAITPVVEPTVVAETPATPVAPAVPVAAKPAPAPEPELNFHLDESQLWHQSEAVKKRISEMSAAAHQTAHLLDEQSVEADRIAKQLKSL
jgi:uncharacterized protein (DUF1800 family)